jgi:uncharacterized small protein (DUF1192 family)
MDLDEFLPRKGQADALAALATEDLDRLSVDELEERVAILTAEIARTTQKIQTSVNHKASAEALFRK